ncbi:hypothetical protein JSY14_04300 [Brachybacterium sp. EF45031]|uniref:hypothetical protein n=1 Tax=Brachybacterium sillae TaxID=2810536 RepID=UPI00217ED307|nr:hypothetical protein [Brachybacterium sillae]MCS6711276.1 hypothetical protein [Brachybacterium sillae]
MSPSEPASHPVRDDSVPRSRGTLRLLSVLLLAAWVSMLLPLPYSLLAGLIGLAALVVMIIAVVQTWREGRRPLATLTALLGVPVCFMLLAGSALSIAFYSPMKELEDCRAEALTEQARTQCDEQARESSAQWVGRLLGG